MTCQNPFVEIDGCIVPALGPEEDLDGFCLVSSTSVPFKAAREAHEGLPTRRTLDKHNLTIRASHIQFSEHHLQVLCTVKQYAD